MLELVEQPEPKTVRTAGGSRVVGFYEYGDPDGTPVVALHGTPACGVGFVWAHQRARARGIRLLAPDRPGVGLSDSWLPGRGATVNDYPAELGAFLDALDIPTCSVLGYSGGGPYALAAAHQLPDRVDLAAIVAGSGHVGVWATLHDFETTDRLLTRVAQRAPRLGRVVLEVMVRSSRLAPKTSLRIGNLEMSASDRAVVAEFPSARDALAMFTESVRRTAAGVVDDYAALGRSWGFAVEEIAVPVHCWHATADSLVPLHHTEELARRIPGAQVSLWDGGGHLTIIHRIDEVFDTLLQHAPR